VGYAFLAEHPAEQPGIHPDCFYAWLKTSLANGLRKMPARPSSSGRRAARYMGIARFTTRYSNWVARPTKVADIKTRIGYKREYFFAHKIVRYQ
jgi:hypothetical protein